MLDSGSHPRGCRVKVYSRQMLALTEICGMELQESFHLPVISCSIFSPRDFNTTH
ncbi:hypothetical protein NQZ68_011202 [Dissostichus eleginoides]|nr:hypothetical protein NQZ68_011202 [Dissostichus eleginoides]